LLDIWNMLEKMNVTISDMDKNASSRLVGLEKKVACLEESVSKKFEAVETDLRVLKESQPPVVSNEAATSNNNDEYEANSNQCVSSCQFLILHVLHFGFEFCLY